MSEGKMGRPELPDGQVKGVIIQTRVSETDRDLIQRAADASGIKLSEWMRKKLIAAAKSRSRQKSG